MLKWVLIGVGILVVAVGAAIWLISNGTLYISNGSGFTAISSQKQPHHQTERGHLRKVVERMLPGDLFDMLWVSWSDDEYTGIMLTLKSGSPVLSMNLKTGSEQAKLESFKNAMAVLGYPVDENSDGFNGGIGEQFRITSLEYTLPKSVDAIVKAANIALTNLHGSTPHLYYLSGSLFAHGPGSGSGIKFSPAEDPLREILAHP